MNQLSDTGYSSADHFSPMVKMVSIKNKRQVENK